MGEKKMRDHHPPKLSYPIGKLLPIPWKTLILRMSMVTGVAFGFTSLPISVHASNHEEMSVGLPRTGQFPCDLLFRRGDFNLAAICFEKAADQFKAQDQVSEHILALINLAQALQRMGHYDQAQDALITSDQLAGQLAEQLAQELDSPILRAKILRVKILRIKILGEKGNVNVLMGKNSKARTCFCQAITLAESLTDAHLQAALYNDFGNFLLADKLFSQAIAWYNETLKLIEGEKGQEALVVSALTNSAQAFFENEQVEQAESQYLRAYNHALQLVPSQTKVYGLLNIGLGFENLANFEPPPRNPSEEKILSVERAEMEGKALNWMDQLAPKLAWRWEWSESLQEEVLGKDRYKAARMAWAHLNTQLDQARREEKNPECSDSYQKALQNMVNTREEFLEFVSVNGSIGFRGKVSIVTARWVNIIGKALNEMLSATEAEAGKSIQTGSTDSENADKKSHAFDQPKDRPESQEMRPLEKINKPEKNK